MPRAADRPLPRLGNGHPTTRATSPLGPTRKRLANLHQEDHRSIGRSSRAKHRERASRCFVHESARAAWPCTEVISKADSYLSEHFIQPRPSRGSQDWQPLRQGSERSSQLGAATATLALSGGRSSFLSHPPTLMFYAI